MATSRSTPFSFLTNTDTSALPSWWMQQWMESANATARLQLVWLEMMGNAMHQEAEFFKIMAISTEKLAHGAMDQELLRDPAAMAAHYQEVAGEIHEATMNRMHKVTELSQDFRECLWEEIC